MDMMVAALAAVIGLILGSFANVVLDRLPRGETIRGRSRCDRCRRTLTWWELVPVLGAVLLRWRCRTCNARIPFRLTIVELGSAALFLLILWRYGGMVTLEGATAALGLWTLGVLAIIDAREGVVPDQISLPAIGVLFGMKAVFIIHYSLFLSELLLPVAIGAGWFAIQHYTSKGRWVGDGDIRVGALMGALLSPLHLLVAFVVSYIIGGAVAGSLLALHRVQRGAHMPMVPFLFAGSVIAALFSKSIMQWYGFPPLLP